MEFNAGLEDNLEAQEKALTIASMVESIEALVDNYGGFIATLPRKHQEEANTYLGVIRAIYETLSDSSSEVSSIVKKNNASLFESSKVKRLGLGKQIVTLKTVHGASERDIAARVGLSLTAVRAFLKTYEGATPTVRNTMVANDVYDIAQNTQRLHTQLLRQMARFEEDGELSAKFMSEYRQIIQMADKQLKEFTTAEKFEKLCLILQDILTKYCTPEARGIILNEMKSLGIKGLTLEATPALNITPGSTG